MEPQSEQDKLRLFTENFFKNLNCIVEWKDSEMVISKVPEEFEKFAGKKGPYRLVFDKILESSESEFLHRGNFLLQAMMGYLDNRGQTTLLKINTNLSAKEMIDRKISLKNSTIFNSSITQGTRQFARFTFLSLFQYLNDKEQILTHLVVEDDQITDREVDSLNLVEGKKEDIKLYDIEPSYRLARHALKSKLADKTTSVTELLKNKLEKEISRIKDHYHAQYREINNSSERQKKQLEDLERQQSKNLHPEPNLAQKISRIKESISSSSLNDQKIEMEREEQFFIQDEIQKHTLNLSNKLINTSIIYYLVYRVNLTIRNEDAARVIDFVLDPMQDSELVKCESCKKAITEIWLCVSGHISCAGCLAKCESCRKQTCLICQERPCHLCGKKLCKKCLFRCPRCNKVACKQSMQVDHLSGKSMCMACLKKCYKCSNYAEIDRFKKSSFSQEAICEKCFRNEAVKRRLPI